MSRWACVGALLWAISILVQPVSAASLPPPDPADGKTFRVLAFHDVREDLRNSFDTDPDETAVSESDLVNLFSWLKHAGYQPVSLEQIVASRNGGAALPAGAVLLSFDDGYRSLYTTVFPLLQRFQYPAVAALVTAWLEPPAGSNVAYGGRLLPRERFVSWSEVREMADSGLVEFASHTHDLHRGAQANPQGNMLPAAAARLYDPQRKHYETDEEYQRRIEADLRRSGALIAAHAGRVPRAIAWPYGAYNDLALETARRIGFGVALTLEPGPNHPDIPLQRIRRSLPTYDLRAADYRRLLRQPAGTGVIRPVNRVMHVDLDYVYDPDPDQQEANLSKLIDRVAAVAPTSVFLQAFVDPDGNGSADALYFPNRHLPVRADLFGRVAWQLRTRARVQVYAWMPVTAFDIETLPRVRTQSGDIAGDRIPRLSSFDPEVRRVVSEIYDDLGRHASFTGLLFHDDALLLDDEDASEAALRTYAEWGLPRDIAAIRADPATAERWTRFKTRHLIDFTQRLADVVRRHRPNLKTARNLYAMPVLHPESEAWFAQTLPDFLDAYTYTAVMAMPWMEKAENPERWLRELVTQVAAVPGGLDRTLFELQARDWRKDEPVDAEVFASQVTLLRRAGARHVGYYPDDFIADHPPLAVVRDAMSVREIPNADVLSRTAETSDLLTQPIPEGAAE